MWPDLFFSLKLNNIPFTNILPCCLYPFNLFMDTISWLLWIITINMRVPMSLWDTDFKFIYIYISLTMELLAFWGISILFSIVAILIHIPNNSVHEFPFLWMLVRICYFFVFLIIDILPGVRWHLTVFQFAFSLWLVLLCIYFHIPVGNLYVLFWKGLFRSFAHL
jgi:hypothetical protein